MFKRILKIVAICLAGFVVICGGAVGIYALQGGFKDKSVNILRLYMEDTTKADKTVYTLTDFTAKIDYEPLNATNTTLQVEVLDPMRPLENGIPVGDGILKDVPKTVKAGEEFTIHINKDSMGNNIGGVANLVFKPIDNDKNITDFTLKVVVDVVIPNNSLYFAGNNSDTYSTTTGKTITMGISNQQEKIYLKSNLVNAFYLQADNKNLKKAYISYVYKTLNGEYYDKQNDKFVKNEVVNQFDDLATNHIYNSDTKEYNYFYEVPVTPSQSGTIKLTAKMHKTYEIEKAYTEGGFDTFVFPSEKTNDAQEMVYKYNAFLNKYKAYIDSSEASYAFFRTYINAKGEVELPYSSAVFEESKKYIFQTCESTINISAVNLDSITSTDTAMEFDVFSTENYSLNASNTSQSIINTFGLDIKLDKDDVAQVDKEKSNLFSTLEVSPYIYIEKSEYLRTKDTLWQGYKMVLGVERFDADGKPVVTAGNISVDGYNGIGFLVLLSGNNSYKEYITCNMIPDAQNKSWNISFNVPMTKSSTETSISSVTKALFLQFQVTGRDLSTNTTIVKDTYTRVFINYTDYQFRNADDAKIAFTNSFKRMSISGVYKANDTNNELNKYYDPTSLNEQKVNIDLSKTITNYSSVQYKNIMYFAEQTSNAIDGGGPKLATIGNYKFRYMSGNSDLIKLNDGEQDLVGERLLNAGSMSDPDYYMYAINASIEPVRIFAVVYLSDQKGNPIDIDGRPIVIDETNDGADPTTLVVFAITDITSSGIKEVYIDNFVSNLNYYTLTKTDVTIEDQILVDDQLQTVGEFRLNANTYVKRNKINNYVTEDGVEFSSETTALVQDMLRLKLLKNNRIDLFATNFEWGEDGKPTDDATNNTLNIPNVKDFYGKTIEGGKTYLINTFQNKQLALNNMCNDFEHEYSLYVQATNSSPVQKVTIVRENENPDAAVIGVKFEIVADGKEGTDGDYIYIKANDGVINGLGKCTDYVEWTVNKLEIEDVTLQLNNADSTYQKLYSSYASDANSDKTQTFGKVTLDNDRYIKSAYNLYNFGDDSQVKKGSIEDNVNFEILTNLYNVERFATTSYLNAELIDMSQFVYENNDGDAVNDLNKNIFKDVKSYIDYYTADTNNMTITYLNPEKVAELKNDLVFTSYGENDNYIHVANASFAIKNAKISINGTDYNAYIEAGGRKYGVTEINESSETLKAVTIKAGEYFPIVRGYTVSNKSIMMILGEEFLVDTITVGGRTRDVIYNIEDKNGYQRQVEVNTSVIINGVAYNPHNYIYDGTKDNTNTNCALEKNTKISNADTYVTSATVSFVKGGTIKNSNNQDIFVIDANGNYCQNQNGDFEIADEGYKGTRYSKKGITAYLMITYKFKGLDGDNARPITKVLTYELVQEPITLIASEENNNNNVILKTNDGSAKEYISIPAGNTTEFHLGTVNSLTRINPDHYYINVLGTAFERSFFLHCAFKIQGGDSTGIKFINENGAYVNEIKITNIDNTLKIYAPSSYSPNTAEIQISYIDENGINVTKVMNLDIKNDYTFKVKDGAENIVTNDKYYEITLPHSTSTSISDLIDTYFTHGLDGVACTVDSTSEKLGSITNGNLNIGKSYATINNDGVIEKDYILINMTIGGLKIAKQLKINIAPEYTFDLRALTTNTINIINGENIFTKDYIKIYYGASNTNAVSVNDYETIFASNILKLRLISDDNKVLDLTGGKVVISDMLSGTKTYTLYIDICGGDAYSYEKTSTISAKVYGYEMYFSNSGDLGLGDEQGRVDTYPSAEKLQEYKTKYAIEKSLKNNNIALTVSKGTKIDLNNYFAVFTANNDIKTNIYAGLLVNGEVNTQITADETTIGEYTLVLGTMEGGKFNTLCTLKYTITISITE